MINLPNALTLIRIALLVPIAFLFFGEGKCATWIIFGLYVISSLTDFLDGYLARKWNQITPFGTFLDPISDKIFVGALFILLIAFNHINGFWIIPVILIFTREFLISGLREFLGPHNVQMPVTKLAKWKTATQMIALGFLILAPIHEGALLAGQLLLLLAAALTLITGWAYMKTGLDYMKRME